ncbi:MAG: DUF1993 domain-containing protein [Myxococcales bacterium]|nr:DUF1993 domain-containing protein [Myxococcales bacterium]
MHHTTVPPLAQMLRNLDGWLEQGIAFAATREMDPELLLEARLYPDMFPLRRQVQAACDSAKLLCARLADVEAPRHEDGPQTLPELRARLAEVVAFIEGIEVAAFEDAAAREITLPFMQGMATTGHCYATEFGLPNFYFHATTAYAILRHVGVKLGKRTYIGHMTLHPARST